eukprot:gene4965-6186_t
MTSTTTTHTGPTLLNFKEEDLETLSISQLKTLIKEANGDPSSCFEKSDLVELAKRLRRSKMQVKTAQPDIRNEKIDYYELLKVPKTATTNEITKAYYKLAKEFHPDKNKNDPYAEEMFKKISEAYQVLTDPEKRKRYDDYGLDGMNEMQIDPLELFRLIFGGGQFQDFFGDLSFYETFSKHMNQNTDSTDINIPPEALLKEEMAKKQKERVDQLVKNLLIIIEPYVQGNHKEFEKIITDRAKEMALAPGGPDLLSLLGYIYIQEAKQHSLFGFFHEISEKGHKAKEIFSTISAAVKMQQQVSRMDESGLNNVAQEENILKEGLKLIWKLGRLDIDGAVREVCEIILHKNVPNRKERTNALKLMGKIFEKIGKENQGGDIDIFKIGGTTSPPQHPQQSQQQPPHYSTQPQPQHPTSTTTTSN